MIVQFHAVGVLVLVSVNWTERGISPEEVFLVKDATGIAGVR